MLRSRASLLAILSLFFVTIQGEWHDDAGPWVMATKGEPWPMPKTRELRDEYYEVDADSFQYKVLEEKCDTLDEAVKRYRLILVNDASIAAKINNATHSDSDERINFKGSITALEIRLEEPCERYPHETSNESYVLNVPGDNDEQMAVLKSRSIWGILRGLETFSQLIFPSDEGSKLAIRGQKITDEPRFKHRGLLLDTSRHYIPVKDIFLILDGMVYNKMNVFHWHIVDDNSFPYQSSVYPELSKQGAYHQSMIYTLHDMNKVIEYARLRGIRVMPEFDTPGHTRSWGIAYPQFLTPCYGTDGKPSGKLGPMNPTNLELYDFMKTLLSEVSQRFPDNYIHLGGDEVPYDCWKSNPDINRYMQKNNITQRFEKLEEIYIQKLLDIMADLKSKPIVWQEVFDNGVKMHDGTIVHIWTGNWRTKMRQVTAAGHPALLSTCWYLDHIAGGGDWVKYYDCDPYDFNMPDPKQKELVLGGEACMWGEFIDKNNVHPRIWPRASAAAERLWSTDRQEQKTVEKRLEEHACRMSRRGIPAQPPNGSGFCID